VLPAGWVTTPGKGAKLDSHGNLAGSDLQADHQRAAAAIHQSEAGERSAARRERSGSASSRCSSPSRRPNKLAKGGGWLPPGVWKHLPATASRRSSSSCKKAGYKQRLNLEQEIKQVLGSQGARRWEEASVLIIRERFNRSR
jgi:hypothetical protein